MTDPVTPDPLLVAARVLVYANLLGVDEDMADAHAALILAARPVPPDRDSTPLIDPGLAARPVPDSGPDPAQARRLAVYSGRIEAFDAVLAYLRETNGNGHDEPSDPALDAVADKVTDLRSRATAALAVTRSADRYESAIAGNASGGHPMTDDTRIPVGREPTTRAGKVLLNDVREVVVHGVTDRVPGSGFGLTWHVQRGIAAIEDEALVRHADCNAAIPPYGWPCHLRQGHGGEHSPEGPR